MKRTKLALRMAADSAARSRRLKIARMLPLAVAATTAILGTGAGTLALARMEMALLDVTAGTVKLLTEAANNDPGGTSVKTALGYAEASTLGLGSGSYFGGIALTDSSAVLVKYTLSADANLDGVVNGLDFNAIATNFGVVTGKVWTQGDFNYDGLTNTLDFNALAGNFNQTLPASAPALGTLVPEPISLAIPAALLFAGRKHRK